MFDLQLGHGIEIERDFNRALDQSQVVMMLRIQAERLAGLSLDLEEYKARYQANAERIAAHAPKAVVMHPGPIRAAVSGSSGGGPHSTTRAPSRGSSSAFDRATRL